MWTAAAHKPCEFREYRLSLGWVFVTGNHQICADWGQIFQGVADLWDNFTVHVKAEVLHS